MNPKRGKSEEQFEQAVENFIKTPAVSVPVIGGVAAFLLYKFWPEISVSVPVGVLSALKDLGGILLVLLPLLLIGLAARWVWVYHYNSKHFRYLQILPHADDEVNPELLGEFMRRVHGTRRRRMYRAMYGKEWFTFLIHYRQNVSRGTQYVFYLGATEDRIEPLKAHMQAFYPKAEFYEAEPDLPKPSAVGLRMDTHRGKESTLALARFKKDQLPGVMEMMKPGTWMQVAFSADDEIKLKKRIIKAESEVKKGKGYRKRTAFDIEEEKSFKSRFYGNEVAFNVLVGVVSESYKPRQVIRNVSDGLAAIMEDVNGLKHFYMLGAVQRYPISFPCRMTWTGSELAKLLHLPDLKADGIAEKIAKEIPHGTKGTQRLPDHVLSDPKGFSFGELVHPLIEGREVKILPQALGKHWGLTGKTGSGKSTILNHILKSFIEQKLQDDKAAGFTFIDPKKETATIVLNNLLKREQEGAKVNWEKVKWISFKGAENPPAMNLLHRMEGVSDTVLTDQIMRIIRENNPNQAMQAERLLKKCIQTLLADKAKTHTILGIKPLLLHPAFLSQILGRLQKDPAQTDLVEFWKYEAPDLVRVSGTAILNRLDVFYSNDFLRRIFGQAEFNFPLRKWMDEGYMVFYDFSGMGEEEIGLIGGYLSYLYYRTADTRPDRSLMHQFVIDESQRVKASILPEIHAEMRSKGLILGISTQTMEKLEPGLQKSLVNIVGNMFVCGQGQSGAKVAADIFRAPSANGKDVSLYSEGYLMNLPERTCVIKTEDKGKTVYAVVTVPPLDRYLPNGRLAAYDNPNEIEKSNMWTFTKAKELESMNGKPIAEIDEDIKHYLGAEPEDLKAAPMMNAERTEITLVPNKKPIPTLRESMDDFSLLGGKGESP